MISPRSKVVVGMSGGLDSSVAACVLKDRGYETIGITLSLWEDGSRCCSERDSRDARSVCRSLGIPHYTVCHTTRFKNEVVDYFVTEYARGRTPNPCVVCNEKVKFRMLLSKAMDVGAHYIATGHYARVQYDPETGHHLLKRGADQSKDQSYFLARLSQRILRRVLFPVGSLSKDQAREAAVSRSLPVCDKEESQEVCFLKDGEQSSFLEKRIGLKAGQIVGEDGQVLGEHKGVYNYTVGQRRGLGISEGHPLYVIGLDPAAGTVFVGREGSLLRQRVLVDRFLLLSPRIGRQVRVEAKIRYGSTLQMATLFHLGREGAEVVFDTPQRAVAPGQLLVAYVGDTVYGSGWIQSSRP